MGELMVIILSIPKKKIKTKLLKYISSIFYKKSILTKEQNITKSMVMISVSSQNNFIIKVMVYYSSPTENPLKLNLGWQQDWITLKRTFKFTISIWGLCVQS